MRRPKKRLREKTTPERKETAEQRRQRETPEQRKKRRTKKRSVELHTEEEAAPKKRQPRRLFVEDFFQRGDAGAEEEGTPEEEEEGTPEEEEEGTPEEEGTHKLKKVTVVLPWSLRTPEKRKFPLPRKVIHKLEPLHCWEGNFFWGEESRATTTTQLRLRRRRGQGPFVRPFLRPPVSAWVPLRRERFAMEKK